MKSLTALLALALSGLVMFSHDANGTGTVTTSSPVRAAGVQPGGLASGSWNLPSPNFGSDGFATGLLKFGGGSPFYLLDASLPLSSVQQVGDHVEGDLFGVLHSFPLSPIGAGGPQVTGHWRSTGPGGGTFTALLHTAGGPLGTPKILLGVVSGTYEDELLVGGPDLLGSFTGLWSLAPPAG